MNHSKTSNPNLLVLTEGARITRSQVGKMFSDPSVYDEIVASGYVTAIDHESGLINFVGIGVYGDFTIIFVPKIFRNSTNISHQQTKILVRTLKKYGKMLPDSHPDAGTLAPSPENGNAVSHIAQSEWLITDYLKKGLYKSKPSNHIKHGAPVIDWNRTITQTEMSISNGFPVYLNPIGRASKADNSHIVTKLHKYALEISIGKYASILGMNTISIDHEVVTSLSKVPEFSFIDRVLKQELHLNFSDREVRLLKVLIAWFSDQQRNTSSKFKTYGVRVFWPIWESICKFIYKDQVALWSKQIPQPLWTKSNGENKYSLGKWLPDVIMASNEDISLNNLFIIDAKYYDCSLPPTLSGEPGISDITKQFFYSQVLETKVMLDGYDGIINCFVFPSFQEDFIKTSGIVDIEGIRGGPILIIYMNFFIACERFLSSASLTAVEQVKLEKECLDLIARDKQPL